ncbi:hypothetical protein G8767_27410 [Rhodococcus sp. IC4_135]|uniref:histidine kinase n=1 Tax=Rhodococcus erythropolis TaxID=1833 RepID=A0A8I1D6N8_RHOER|nr:ATP-binding protein [Rhodococcus erythropolis]MBH5143447.1 hypothetical protein [Rhodococcus erythropolis]NHP17279.1 hypothetical protein [Rhodococcus sp. IC4_135]
MRRNGENLLILAGDHDRRTRQAPIGFGDIVRAAISEVESYQRVQVRPAPSGALTGSVAVDLVHILAELVDNALRFSPPESTVMIGFARTIEGGTVISVVDHGIGISRDDVSAINTRLATRADATADTTRHMGLFVVGQLAARHRVTVQLTATTPVARNGDVTATVDIPGQLLVSPAEIERRRPAAPAATLFALASPRDEHPPTASLPPPPVPPVPSPALPVRVRPVQSNLSGASESGDGESAEPARGSGPDSETVSTASSPRHLRTSAYTPPVPAAVTDDEGVTTPIFFGMVSEWLTDPATPRSRPGPEWVSPADAGWSAARHAAHAPVENRTESGLPQRVPGDRIVPGGLDGVGAARRRDPDAIRENLTRHLAGVRNGRSTSRPT